MSRQRRQFSAEFKTKVVLELLEGSDTLNQIASKYDILPKMLLGWKKQFFSQRVMASPPLRFTRENAALVFEPAKAVKEYKDEIDELRKQNDDLAKALGKATVERDWLAGKLAGSVSSSDRRQMIETGPQALSLSVQCRLLRLHRTGLYYQAHERFDSEDIVILNRMDEIYTESPFYGHRRIAGELHKQGFVIGRHRVAKYMKVLGVKALYPHKKRSTSIKHPEHQIYPYLLNKSDITQANQVWCGDITYVGLHGGFAYLAVVMDWHTKKVLSWKLDTVMDASLSTAILQKAIETHGKPYIFNSDQGRHVAKRNPAGLKARGQYTLHQHIELLKNSGISISMNGKGRSSDNIAVERFFRSLKYENIYLKRYQTLKEAREGIKAYIEFYNTRRLHSSLGYDTPQNVYERQMNQAA